MEIGIRSQFQGFEVLYQNAPCGLMNFTIEGKIVTANNTLLKWLGITDEEIAKKAFTDLLDRGGQLYYQLFVQPMLTMHQEVMEINISLKTEFGSIPCLLNAVVLANENGTEKVVHAAIFRMGERKKYELELLHKKMHAEKEKQRKAAVLEEVAFDQSHLVRVPLANILGLVSLVEATDLNEETQKLFNLIEQSVLQLDMEVRKIVVKTAV